MSLYLFDLYTHRPHGVLLRGLGKSNTSRILGVCDFTRGIEKFCQWRQSTCKKATSSFSEKNPRNVVLWNLLVTPAQQVCNVGKPRALGQKSSKIWLWKWYFWIGLWICFYKFEFLLISRVPFLWLACSGHDLVTVVAKKESTRRTLSRLSDINCIRWIFIEIRIFFLHTDKHCFTRTIIGTVRN